MSYSTNSRYTKHISNKKQWKEIPAVFQAFGWLWDPHRFIVSGY